MGFDFIERNEQFLCSMDADSMLAIIAHTTSAEYRRELARHFSELQETGASLPIEPENLAEMFVGAMSQTSRWWLAHRDAFSKEEMVQKLSIAFAKMLER